MSEESPTRAANEGYAAAMFWLFMHLQKEVDPPDKEGGAVFGSKGLPKPEMHSSISDSLTGRGPSWPAGHRHGPRAVHQ
jgi:hypothetical protein